MTIPEMLEHSETRQGRQQALLNRSLATLYKPEGAPVYRYQATPAGAALIQKATNAGFFE